MVKVVIDGTGHPSVVVSRDRVHCVFGAEPGCLLAAMASSDAPRFSVLSSSILFLLLEAPWQFLSRAIHKQEVLS